MAVHVNKTKQHCVLFGTLLHPEVAVHVIKRKKCCVDLGKTKKFDQTKQRMGSAAES